MYSDFIIGVFINGKNYELLITLPVKTHMCNYSKVVQMPWYVCGGSLFVVIVGRSTEGV